MELFSSRYLQCLALLLICVSVEYTVNGIECYQCNSGTSYSGSACDTFETTVRDSFKVNCISSNDFNYTRCRKTVQTVKGETQVIRSCATAGHSGGGTRCIDRIGTANVKVKYCECTDPLCNSSAVLLASLLLVAIGYAIASSAKMIL